MYNLKRTLQEIVVTVVDLDDLPSMILKEIEVGDDLPSMILKEIEVEDDFPSLIELGVSPGVFTYLQ